MTNTLECSYCGSPAPKTTTLTLLHLESGARLIRPSCRTCVPSSPYLTQLTLEAYVEKDTCIQVTGFDRNDEDEDQFEVNTVNEDERATQAFLNRWLGEA